MQAEDQINIDQQLQKLNHIAEILGNQPPKVDAHLKDYIGIYVQYHNLSEQFFIGFCEHQILRLMLQAENRLNSSVCILECLNLLLVNTRSANQLVYFFSQKSLHTYLFTNSLEQDSEYIEYLIQLFKTILLKLNQPKQNINLIQLFYNNKYHNFPIFTHTALLATSKNQLVKVTAQQCILFIIALCNRYRLLNNFLGELPLIYMMLHMMNQFEEQSCDNQGVFNYIADLFYQLRMHRAVLLLLNNFIFNYICLRHIPSKYQIPLKFMIALENAITNKIIDKKQQNKLVKEQCNDLLIICATHLRTLIKYLTNKYINGQYLSNLLIFSQKQPIKQPYQLPTLNKYFLQSMPELTNPQNRQQDRQKQKTYFEELFVHQMKNKVHEYEKSAEFQKIKYKHMSGSGDKEYMKAIGSAFQFLYKKTYKKEGIQEWASRLWVYAGVGKKKGLVLENFGMLMQPDKSVFIGEFCQIISKIWADSLETFHFGQDTNNIQGQQTIYNNFRYNWGFNKETLKILYSSCTKFITQTLSSSQQELLLPKIYVHPTYLFIMQLKSYLQFSLSQIFDDQPRNKVMFSSVDSVIILSKICGKLKVQLTNQTVKLFAFKIHSLQGFIQGKLFQNCFEAAVKYFGIRYLLFSKQFAEAYIYIKDKQQQNIISSLTYYECFQKIINPNHKLLSKFYELKWQDKFKGKTSTIGQQPVAQQIFYSGEVAYNDKSSLLEIIRNNKANKIMITIREQNKLVISVDLCAITAIRTVIGHNNIIYFDYNKNCAIQFKNQHQLAHFQQKFTEFKLDLLEIVTSTMIEYLQHTYKEQCTANFYQQHKKKAMQEKSFTPHG